MQILRYVLLLAALSAPVLAAADAKSVLSVARGAANLRLAGTEDPDLQKVYIVQLRAPAAAERHAKSLRAARSAAIGVDARQRFDKNSAIIQSYAAELVAVQQQVMARAGDDVEPIYSYVYGLNGFAARMTPAQAHKLESLPQVLRVWEDEIRPLATSFSPDYLALFDSESGLRSARGLDGEDIVIGFIDSGAYPEHPALSDTQEADRPRACRGSWAENTLLGRWLCRRYRRAEDRIVYTPPENWNGICETGEQFAETEKLELMPETYFLTRARIRQHDQLEVDGRTGGPLDVDHLGTAGCGARRHIAQLHLAHLGAYRRTRHRVLQSRVSPGRRGLHHRSF